MDIKLNRKRGPPPIPMVRLHTRITVPAHIALTRMQECGIINSSVGRWLSGLILEAYEVLMEEQEHPKGTKENNNDQQTKPK